MDLTVYGGEGYPGIAMSRSVGDLVAKEIGVTSDPEISVREVSKKDRYIVLASDDLWEYVGNERVKEIVDGAVDALIEEATLKFEEQNEARDDITVLVYFFNH